MEFAFVVSNTGCILQIDKTIAAGLESAGLEIFDSHDAAAARYMRGDVGEKPLVYFEAQYYG
jgi:hypothetical protein